MLAPFPRVGDIAGFYPPVYTFGLEHGTQSALRRWLSRIEYACFYQRQYEAQVRRALKAIGRKNGNGLRLLDVGCGRGLRLLAFQRHGFDVYGMDFQEEAVSYVREQLKIPAVCSDADQLTGCFEAESFDLITSFYVLEHVPDVAALVKIGRASCRERV